MVGHATIAPMRTGPEALDALRALPCGRRLAWVLAQRSDTWLVGGAVRDLLLGREPRELDVVTTGEAATVAAALGEIQAAHERFGTLAVRFGPCEYDVVRARAERYPRPGALPEVRPAGLDADLARRDFSINALALDGAGRLRGVPGALEDLAAGRLRVLHERSFHEDPTRLWRLVRYAVRLGFPPDRETDRLAAEAVAADVLTTVSGDRVGAELRLALREPRPLDALHAAQNLGLVAGLDLDPARAASALAILPPDGRADLTVLGAAVPDGAWAAPFGFNPAEQRILDRCARLAPVASGRPSAVARALRAEPVEAIAVAGARGDAVAARNYLERWRHVRLEIDGHDLVLAGVPEGPEVGARLARVLDRRLDGELGDGRDAQLAAALADPGWLTGN